MITVFRISCTIVFVIGAWRLTAPLWQYFMARIWWPREALDDYRRIMREELGPQYFTWFAYGVWSIGWIVSAVIAAHCTSWLILVLGALGSSLLGRVIMLLHIARCRE